MQAASSLAAIVGFLAASLAVGILISIRTFPSTPEGFRRVAYVTAQVALVLAATSLAVVVVAFLVSGAKPQLN